MAKTKGDKKLYQRLRVGGVRKRVARELAELPAIGSNGKRVPKGIREAIERLEKVASELRKQSIPGARKPAAGKATRTRRKSTQTSRSSTRRGTRQAPRSAARRTKSQARRSSASGSSARRSSSRKTASRARA